MKAARRDFHLKSSPSPCGRPCALKIYRNPLEKSLVDYISGPGMVRFGEPVLDAIFPAAHIEHVGGVTRGWAIGVPWRERELNAVIGQHGMDFVEDGFDEGCQEG